MQSAKTLFRLRSLERVAVWKYFADRIFILGPVVHWLLHKLSVFCNKREENYLQKYSKCAGTTLWPQIMAVIDRNFCINVQTGEL